MPPYGRMRCRVGRLLAARQVSSPPSVLRRREWLEAKRPTAGCFEASAGPLVSPRVSGAAVNRKAGRFRRDLFPLRARAPLVGLELLSFLRHPERADRCRGAPCVRRGRPTTPPPEGGTCRRRARRRNRLMRSADAPPGHYDPEAISIGEAARYRRSTSPNSTSGVHSGSPTSARFGTDDTTRVTRILDHATLPLS